jgi:hypothetical protein
MLDTFRGKNVTLFLALGIVPHLSFRFFNLQLNNKKSEL